MVSKRVGLAMVLALVCARFSGAQTNAARVFGSLTDETGALLPSAEVTVTNVETGISRTVVSDEQGRFLVPQLSPGPYKVTATMPGFDTLVRTGITLLVGQEVNLALQMKVGAVTDQVTVTGEVPLVNTTNGVVSGVIEEKRIEELPLNGRDFTKLALLQPSIALARKTDVQGSKGFGTRISMAGSRVDQTAWFLDGTNIRGNALFGVPGSAAGLVLGVDAVREFQVLTSSLSAEFGGTSGGVINMVTKSGTNQFHGSMYEFLRNNVFDARNFFDGPKLEFRRNQFGASLGGPIKSDRTFFFGNYEGLREGTGRTSVATVPDELVHQGLIPASGGGRQQIEVAPEIRPFLDLYPMPNSQPVGVNSGFAQFRRSATYVTSENYFVTRLDHNLTPNQNLFFRFTFDKGKQFLPDSLGLALDHVFTGTRYFTMQYQKVFSSHFLATSRAAFNRSMTDAASQILANFPAATYVFIKEAPAAVSFTGADTLGVGRDPEVWRQNVYQFTEDMGYTRGSHALKFGFDVQKDGFNYKPAGDRRNGTFGWANLRAFLEDQPLQTFSVPATGSSQVRSLRQEFFGAYLQDQWKWRRVSINLGVRYEPYTVPTEKWGRLATVRDWRTATRYETNIPWFQNFSLKNIGPRVGFAWDPQGDGKMAIRGGFGLFFEPISGPQYRTTAGRNPPFYALIQQPVGRKTLASAPADVAAIEGTLLTPVTTPATFMQLPYYYLNSPYEMKFNLNVERELPGAMSVSVGYIGGRGIHLWRLDSCNTRPSIIKDGRQFVDASTPRPNPNLGSCAMSFSDAQSFYNGLNLEVKKRFTRGFQFQTSYTWSKAIDDSTTGFVSTDYGEGGSSQPGNRKADRGLSAVHVGQNIVVNGIYAMPSPMGSSIVKAVFGGWQFSPVLSAATGIPFSPLTSGQNAPDLNRSNGLQRPDLVPGRNNGNIVHGTTAGCKSPGGTTIAPGQKLGGPNLYFDPCAFTLPAPGFYGNAGRNILIGPGMLTFDTSLQKSVPLKVSEAARLEFRWDVFNLFNRANFATPSGSVLNPSNGTYIASAGIITGTATSSRQMQFGLKLIF